MKIVYFMNHVGIGGAALALYDLICELKTNNNIKVIAITGKKNELNEQLKKVGIENYSAPFKNFLSSYKKPKLFWKFLLKIRYWLCKPIACYKIEKLIDFETVDIIHTNLNRIDIGVYFSKKYSIPHIWHIREHGEGDFQLMSLYNNYIKHMRKYHSNYIVISDSVKRIWIQKGLPEKNITLIYDGIRTEGWTKHRKSTNQKLKIIFLGGYYKNKGQSFFIEALSKVPIYIIENVKIDFYGNGNHKYIGILQEKVNRYHLENIITLNDYCNDIYKKLYLYDIGVNCSRAEGFGRVTVEYMMAGLCPLVSNTGANKELVKDNITGMIFQYDDINEIVNKIVWAYENREQIFKMGSKAAEYACNNFSMKHHAEQIKELYTEVSGIKL